MLVGCYRLWLGRAKRAAKALSGLAERGAKSARVALMPKRSKILSWSVLSTAALALCVLGAACGDDGNETPGPVTCHDYGTFQGMTPTVSFKTDVLPLFRRSCGVGGAACHGDENGLSEHPYLGPKNDPAMPMDATQAQIDAIFMQVVSKPAVQAPMTMLVEPGKPELSYLMHKMDGTQGTCADAKCTAIATKCDSSMPLSQDLLPAEERETVRRWIAQGAKND